MKARIWPYFWVYLTPAVVFFSLSMSGYWTYATLVLIFGILPAIELFLSGSRANLSEEEEAKALANPLFDWMLYSLLPLQYLALAYFLYRIGQADLPLYAQIGMTTAFGISCGVLGINAAHELGHRDTVWEQTMSKLLLLSTLYMHFFIEHNRGHHKHVSTDEDPASARYGENLYAFYWRSVTGSWRSAWRLEAERLRQKGLGSWTWQNEMLRFQLIQLALVAGIGLAFGWAVLGFYLAAACIGFLLLETVNYIEHYGLRRQKKGQRYERVLPIHSWNSNHPLGRAILLELSRHSDHHYMANRKYQILRHFEDSPQMPTGYPGMMLLAFLPPLWFAVMHRHIERYRQGQDGAALA